jgi:hypothetical protein
MELSAGNVGQAVATKGRGFDNKSSAEPANVDCYRGEKALIISGGNNYS